MAAGAVDGAREGPQQGPDAGQLGEAEPPHDPTDPDSYGDDVTDGQEDIGYVASFSNGTLTIDLSRGGTVSVLIDENTYIACDRKSEDEDLDGECLTSDLKPGRPRLRHRV